MNAEGGSETTLQSSTGNGDSFNVRVRWAIPQRLDHMTFVGKETLAVAHDIYIIFINLRTYVEKVYVPNSRESGDGVDVIAGHRSNLFAFADKSRNSRIFIMSYPSLKMLAEMNDEEVNRYKGLCMLECDLVAGFSGFPNYMLAIWSWRTNQKLISVPTGVIRRNQIFSASRTHMLCCECWGEGLIVWEVAQCFKKCLMMKRAKEEVVGWDVSDPPLVGLCWAYDGQLYAIDCNARLYAVVSDGIGMRTSLEWCSEHTSQDTGQYTQYTPRIAAFGQGLLVYGPDNQLRALHKAESKWKVVFTFTPMDPIAALVSSAYCDHAAMWTRAGLLYKVTGDSEEKVEVTPVAYKQRSIKKIQMIAPAFEYLATINDTGMICIYEMLTGKLVMMKIVEGKDVSFESSPVEPIIAVFGNLDEKYGVTLYLLQPDLSLKEVSRMCLTHQLVERVAFSSTGRELLVAAMSAGHMFVLNLSPEYKLTLVRYSEVGRGLADCFLMRVGDSMRAFSLVLFSDKYLIGERIICINAETGKDNKFAGKMAGPYARLLPLSTPDHMLAVPHLSRSFHVLKLKGEKGITVSVKMGPIIDSGHDIKHFDGFYNVNWLLTAGYDGNVVLRKPDAASTEYDLKLVVSHRYEHGIKQAVTDVSSTYIAHVAGNGTCAVTSLRGGEGDVAREPLQLNLLDQSNVISCCNRGDKTYLEIQEDKKVHEETMDYKTQREEVVQGFKAVQKKVIELLEENIAEIPLHQLSLSEFNIHQEHRRERKMQAEREREEIRLSTEALIRAQDKVTLWIKNHCWDAMLTPRIKLFAIFSHYQVENYPVLPSQRDKWPELNMTEALRLIECENDSDVFRPWEEPRESSDTAQLKAPRESITSERDKKEVAEVSRVSLAALGDDEPKGQPYVLSGSLAHHYVQVPSFMIPQTLAFSYLQMNWLHHIVKLTVQNMRLWFNKQFDDLMALKKREVGLVEERNNRLRFIIEELNKLSDLRGSFHHLTMQIQDPQWAQEEQPQRLIKVDPEECSIEPYISPSQIVIVPPDPGPKDDFRERALIDMMDGVLEKLWHEEIKKPIPVPQCMLDKEPENFNEEDLRQVFEYEAKVAFRNEERDKYRKMLHAEYSKLSQVLNEGVVKFNAKVKETWLLKLKVDSVIGQETLNLMRLRRENLDRLEMAENLEDMRAAIGKYESETETLSAECAALQEQGAECQAVYDTLLLKDKYMERTFKNHFQDLSPIIVDQCYKFFRKRPKWQQRATMIPVVLYELAGAILSGVKPYMLHPDCLDYFKSVEQLDQVSNMPPVMDEALWATMCKLRRTKIDNEIRMRGVALEMGYLESAMSVWHRAIQARRTQLALTADLIAKHRHTVQLRARNRTIQLVLPAGQVEIVTTGHMEDFEDAALIPRDDIETINNLILRVGALKLRMMRRQMEFRKVILAKEWEHAQVKMKLRHMKEELLSYRRLKIPKELQLYLKNKELGCTEEQEFVRMEKEMEASKFSVNKALAAEMQRVEELQLKSSAVESATLALEQVVERLTLQVSEKRLHEDPLEPIRIRRVHKKRMETLVTRSHLIREVQANHTCIVMLQTELELLRLKTYPTLACFRTYD